MIAAGHGLRTPWEKIALTARPKIQSQSQIFRYSSSIFCLPHRPNFSVIFDLCLHWVSVVRVGGGDGANSRWATWFSALYSMGYKKEIPQIFGIIWQRQALEKWTLSLLQCLAFWLWPMLLLSTVTTTTFPEARNLWQDLTQVAGWNGGPSKRLDIKKLPNTKKKLFMKMSAITFMKLNANTLRYVVCTYIAYVNIW